jgi:shikimate kinase
MKSNVALIGFMGVGKTVVGKALAKKLNWKFVELDLLIEQKVDKSIPEIFETDGEVVFRQLEIEVTNEVSLEENAVIACGGGIVLNQINVDRLRQKSTIVYLTASPAVILKQVLSDSGERPLLKVVNPALTIRELLRFRKPFYERAADIKIDTSKLSVDAAVEQIIRKMRENESLHS